MAYDIALLARSPSLCCLPQDQANLVLAARLWVTMRKRGLDPSPAMTQRFGSSEAAWRFWLLMEETGTAWPEPFLVSPPCCRRLTHDEATLVEMAVHAAAGARAEALRLLGDMMPVESADRLHASALRFLAALEQPADL